MTLKEKLASCSATGTALLAANFYNFETLKGLLLGAKEAGSPLILQLSESSLQYLGIHTAADMAHSLMKELDVTAWLHLDHGSNLHTIRECLDAGFDSVMIDASESSFNENVRITNEVMKMAAPYGANVEAELGYIAKLGQQQQAEPTSAADARLFEEATGVHALAIAIGNAHGTYKRAPILDFQRVSDLVAAHPVPIALHGGSGLSDDQFHDCIGRGCAKVNISTALKETYMQSNLAFLREAEAANKWDPPSLFTHVAADVRAMTKHYAEVFGSAGKA